MDQTMQKKQQITGKQYRIAYIQAGWHKTIVEQAFLAFVEECSQSGIKPEQIELFDVPGSLEIPLQTQTLAKLNQYDLIVAAGLIVDGGIYRHDFVAATVLDAIMQVQLEREVPILSIVLTPHHFQESEAHESFFFEHFKIKGAEAARACLQTLENCQTLQKSTVQPKTWLAGV